jgi:hypothetical protein
VARVIPRLAVALAVVVAASLVLFAVLYWAHHRDTSASGPSPTWTAGPTAEPAGPQPAPTTSPGPAVQDPGSDPRFDRARAQLAALPVKGWDRNTDFKRYRFGKAWSDEVNVEFGHNGCNTRDDILRRDLADLVVRRGTCYADRGTLEDPYTGERIAFVRGPDTSNSVEIDHLVSLADAWYKGARTWDDQRRLDFANDPRNLLAVSPQANFNKAFRDAASWLPPNEGFRCEFVRRQIEVKTAYGLWLAEKEKRALTDVLKRC